MVAQSNGVAQRKKVLYSIAILLLHYIRVHIYKLFLQQPLPTEVKILKKVIIDRESVKGEVTIICKLINL